jgi:hypothetical protein
MSAGDLFKKWYVGHRPNDLYAKSAFLPTYDLYTTVQNDHGVLIEVRGDLGDFDRQRVAYFIAAAPEMLEALKELLPLAESFYYDVNHGDEYVEQFVKARAAIAKAEGREP